jgi:branched-chain amino acid transport system permease protein
LTGGAPAARRAWMLWPFAAVAFLAFPLLPLPDYWFVQLGYIGLYATVALGLVLLTGVAGLTSFGQSAFVGIAAYTTAWMCTRLGISPWMTLPFAMALTCGGALLLGMLTLRMSSHYLPLATIAWCLAINYAVANLDVLGKFDGIVGIPTLRVGNAEIASAREMFYPVWAVAIGGGIALANLLDSRIGRAMRALKEGGLMVEAMGISAFRYKLVVFLVAALYAAMAGWLFAHFQRTVNPSPFGIKMGIEFLLMAVVGGGSIGGAFVGAAIVKGVEDQLQMLLPALFGASGSFEVIVFGAALIVVLKFMPQGVWPALRARLPVAGARTFPTLDSPIDELRKRQLQPPGQPLLAVHAISKDFGGLVAVDNVSFTLRTGEILGLIGPNGAGKSTTFNLISGVVGASRGDVLFRGVSIKGAGVRRIAAHGISRTFQHAKLIPDMTVLENVALGAHSRTEAGLVRAVFRFARDEEASIRAEAMRHLRRVGLAEVAHQPASTLALGQQRLAEVARALCADPELLMLDEPAAGLRYAEKAALADCLAQLRRQHMSLLLVEHDMEFLMKLVDRVVVMNSGTFLMEGTPAQVQASAAVRAAYLGEDT